MNDGVKYAPDYCRNSGSFAALVNYDSGDRTEPGILLRTRGDEFERYCEVQNYGYPGGPPSSGNPIPITAEEFQSCKSILAARANEVTDGFVWNCFAE